jgi:hypothetical protein
MSGDEFVQRLRAEVPQFSDAVDQHIADNDEVLLHLLLGELARASVAAWESKDVEFNRRALALLDAALADGDDYVTNAVSVSFVEDIGPWDTSVKEFVASWPPALLRDAQRAGFTQ